MKRRSCVIDILLAASMCALCGCPPPPRRFVPAPIPIDDAIRIANANTGKITGTLRASGSVDGKFTDPDGRSHSYHVNGVLFYLAPTYVRFDLKSFGDRQFLLGSNADLFWYYDKEEDRYHCGWHDESDELAAALPIHPDQLVDALGLTPIPAHCTRAEPSPNAEAETALHGLAPTGRAPCVQRVVGEHQQILFLERDEEGRVTLEKEYWLDRYPPRLIRRVVFRDADGVVEMRSQLDQYRPLSSGGPMLPRVMAADWPKSKASIRFRINKWSLVEQIGPESVQFAVPRDCPAP